MAEATAPPPGGSRGFFSAESGSPGRRAVAVARGQVCPPTPRVREETGRGGGRKGEIGACDAPPQAPLREVTARPLGVRLPLSVTVGGGGKGRRDRPRPSARDLRGRAGLEVEGRSDIGMGAGFGWSERRGLVGVF